MAEIDVAQGVWPQGDLDCSFERAAEEGKALDGGGERLEVWAAAFHVLPADAPPAERSDFSFSVALEYVKVDVPVVVADVSRELAVVEKRFDLGFFGHECGVEAAEIWVDCSENWKRIHCRIEKSVDFTFLKRKFLKFLGGLTSSSQENFNGCFSVKESQRPLIQNIS